MTILFHHSVSDTSINTSTRTRNGTIVAQAVRVIFSDRNIAIYNIYILSHSCYPPGFRAELELIYLYLMKAPWLEEVSVSTTHVVHSWDKTSAAKISYAINNSSFAILNNGSPTRLSTTDNSSSPDLSLISGHIALDCAWCAYLCLDRLWHIPAFIQLDDTVCNELGPWAYTNFRRANWSAFRVETEMPFASAL